MNNKMHNKYIKYIEMSSKNIMMQIAMIDAFRSEAIKAKEEFDWPFKPRKDWVFSRFTKLFSCLFFKEVSADSVRIRKKLNKNRNNTRIVEESASIKRSSSQKCL